MALRTRNQGNVIRRVDQENVLNPIKGKTNTILPPKRAVLGDISTNVQTSKTKETLKNDSLVKPACGTSKAKENAKIVQDASSKLPRPKAQATTKPFVPGRILGLKKSEKVVETCKPTEKPAAVIPPLIVIEDFVDIDKDDGGNPFLVSEYANDIYSYLRQLERKFPIKENYLAGQRITSRMRATLIDWLVDVQQQYHLFPETLHLCVAIIDMFLQKVLTITRDRLQLVGVTAMLIACKFEETYSPDVSDFVYITDNTFSKIEILAMEKYICSKLGFELGRPLSLHFLRRYSKAANATAQQHSVAKYILELALLEYKMVHVPPSLVAAVASFIALSIVDCQAETPEAVWTNTMIHYSTYKLKDLKSLVTIMASVILKASTSKLLAVFKKYNTTKLHKVSTLPELASESLKKLAAELS